MRKKQVVCSLVSIYFDSPQPGVQQKQPVKKFWQLIQRYAQFWFFKKGSGNSFSTTFCVSFFQKNAFYVILYWLTKFHCLIAFIFWDVGKYVYCNCLFPRLWRDKFWNWHYLFDQAVFLQDQRAKCLNIMRTKRVFKVIWKAFFIIFKGNSVP